MTDLKNRILNLVKNALNGRMSESLLLETFEMDEELESVPIEQIKIAIAQLLNDCKIEETVKLISTDSPTAFKQKTIYTMPDSFYRPEIHWGWESYLKLVCPWGEVEKKFSSGEWVYSSWRRGLGDEVRWVREPIPKEMRDMLKLERAWVRNSYWQYSLIGRGGKVYTLREEANDCD